LHRHSDVTFSTRISQLREIAERATLQAVGSKVRERKGAMQMRKTLLAIAAISLLSTPALAASNVTVYGDYNPAAPAEVTTGAVAGTAVGVGVSEGWFGASGALGSSSAIAASTAGAVTVGGVAGVGTVAALDSVIQPCRGFQALFGANKESCVNGHYVGPHGVIR
jgi:hypothetical protein